MTSESYHGNIMCVMFGNISDLRKDERRSGSNPDSITIDGSLKMHQILESPAMLSVQLR